MCLDAIAITYNNISGPYSYTIVCESGSDCFTEEIEPSCEAMTAGGVICGGVFLSRFPSMLPFSWMQILRREGSVRQVMFD